MKTLIFEGAGWEKAEHNGVGNCRIRTTFKNKKGVIIYLEINGIKPHKWSPEYAKNYNFMGWISHCLIGFDKKQSNLETLSFEYTKENILSLVNSLELNGDFDSIEVNNENYNGFALDGKDDKDVSK